MSNTQIASNWPAYRKVWMIVTVISFLVLLVLWLLGYGPGGSKCVVPPTIVEKVVEKEKLIDNPHTSTESENWKKRTPPFLN